MIWGTEPTLWQLAEETAVRQPLPRHPQIAACFPGASDQPAVDLCTLKMRVSLWGPPERLTLTLGKNDVWDRRRAWEQPYTLGQVWAGAFAERNEGEPRNLPAYMTVQPYGYYGDYLHPHGGYHNPYPGGSAYPFPSPNRSGRRSCWHRISRSSQRPRQRRAATTARRAWHCAPAARPTRVQSRALPRPDNDS